MYKKICATFMVNINASLSMGELLQIKQSKNNLKQ